MISTSHFHPMLVHFPIALVAVGFLAEIAAMLIKKEACLSVAGFYLLILGTLSAIVAWGTGNFFTAEMEGAAGEIKELHEQFAIATLVILVVASIIRIYIKMKNKESSGLKLIAFVLYALSAICVSITGFYGGTLVYNYMMPL